MDRPHPGTCTPITPILESIPLASEVQKRRLDELADGAPDDRFRQQIYTNFLPTMRPNKYIDGAIGRGGGYRLRRNIAKASANIFEASQALGELTWRHEAAQMAEFYDQMARAGENGFIPIESFNAAMIDFATKRQIGNIESSLQAIQKKARILSKGVEDIVGAGISNDLTTAGWLNQLWQLVERTTARRPDNTPVEGAEGASASSQEAAWIIGPDRDAAALGQILKDIYEDNETK